MARKNIYETEQVRNFVAGMSSLSKRKYKVELAKGIARTQADMDVVLRDSSIRNEVGAVEARYAALELLEGYFKTAAGERKLGAYRSNYHRDFIVTVALNDNDDAPVSVSSRELSFV